MASKKLNNVNVERLGQFLEEARRDPSKLRKVNQLEGEWNLNSGPQFSAVLTFEQGKMTVEADQATAQGGSGSKPGPVQYCLYGLLCCYAATYATVAAMEGVPLRRLTVRAENRIDFSRMFGLGDAPPVDKISVTLRVEADAPEKRLRELEEMAKKRCPAVYCLTQPIALETHLEVGGAAR